MRLLYTRGIWENIDGGELCDVFAEASNEPQELIDNVEELFLSRQPAGMGKCIFVTVFVNKVFIDPNRKPRVLMIGLGDTLALKLQYDKAEEKYLEAKATANLF